MSGSILGTSALTPYQTIAFNEVPSTWNVPGNYVEVRPNYVNQGLSTFPTRALIVAPMLAGAGVSGTPFAVYPVTRKDQPAALFGAGSIAQAMAAAFLAAAPTIPLYVLGVSDATGATQATSTITCTGAATANGTDALYVAGAAVPTTILLGDAPAAQATKIAASVNAVQNLPVTATAAAGVVTLTARGGGALTNAIDVRYNYNAADAYAPGTVRAVTAMAGGTGTPTLAGPIADIQNQWFTDIVIPWTDATSMTAFTIELAARYVALGKLDAFGYQGLSATYGAALPFGLTQNSQYNGTMPMQNPVTPPWVLGAVLSAVAAFNLTNDPARQLRGKALPGVLAPAPADRFTDIERQQLLSEGLSTYGVLQDGTVVIERLVTNYQVSTLGVPDASWMDIMTPKVMTRIRYDWRKYLDTTYPSSKLAPDGSIAANFDASNASPSVVTPRRMSNSWAARSLLYEQAGWIVNSQATAAASVFEIDAANKNRMDSQLQVQVIGNLMIQAVALEFS